MSGTIMVAGALSGANLLLLGAVSGLWIQNYRSVGTSFVLGLLAFAVALFAENALALYFFVTMQSLYAGDPHVQQAVLLLRAVQFVAVVVLTYTTLR
ncbi:hypothetical protein [Halobaculum sp. MBLA0143]|uniref:hypothetical protein n=1 Tax=Halobaculum sp. MBLA0143 TaxID=3079933 RepID=UPI003526AC0F